MNQNFLEPLIRLHDVSVRVGGRWVLTHLNWRIRQGENWVVWGANGAGKTTLANALAGQAAVVQGKIHRLYESEQNLRDNGPAVALVSSEQYHDLFNREQLLEEMRCFSGRTEEKTFASDMFPEHSAEERACWTNTLRDLQLAPLLGKPVAALSSGEISRLLLARALCRNARLLLLDEPFNGLDQDSRQRLKSILGLLVRQGTQMVLITHRMAEVPPFFSHLLHLDKGNIAWQGLLEDYVKHHPSEGRICEPPQDLAHALKNAAAAGNRTAVLKTAHPERNDRQASDTGRSSQDKDTVLVRMRNVTVRYGRHQVLNNVNWTLRWGENWALVGPNGAGKTTLLRLITGDNIQGYANELMLFGHRKGSGESVWEIKQHIGYVGDELQARSQRNMSGFDAVCSGFFDSVGLYRLCTKDQRQTARQWMRRLNLEDLAQQRFVQLSFGQQRLVLIARAMVKSPQLLILDEPCNGLDEINRCRLLQSLELIGGAGHASILYVSHRPEEIPSCVTHRLYLEAGRVVSAS